jgi:hypothetical protein
MCVCVCVCVCERERERDLNIIYPFHQHAVMHMYIFHHANNANNLLLRPRA